MTAKPIQPPSSEIDSRWSAPTLTLKFNAESATDQRADGIKIDTASLLLFVEDLLYEGNYHLFHRDPPKPIEVEANGYDFDDNEHPIVIWKGVPIKLPTALVEALIDTGRNANR
jgi:hypothetical protein